MCYTTHLTLERSYFEAIGSFFVAALPGSFGLNVGLRLDQPNGLWRFILALPLLRHARPAMDHGVPKL